MIILNPVGMERLGQIQDKYRFMNAFELEQDDVYEFCTRIIEAYHIGLCMDDEDIQFIERVLEKLCS